MGLLDALFQNDSGGGLLSGLPSSWQWQNPADKQKNDDFLSALRQDPSTGAFGGTFTNPPTAPVFPNYTPPPSPSIFDQRSVPSSSLGGMQPGPIAGSFVPPSAPQAPPLPPAQPIAPAPQSASPASPAQAGPINNMNIGGYQMPQFGSAADYTPQQTVPQRVANAQAQAPQEPSSQLPPAFGGGDNRLMAFLQSAGHPGGLLQNMANGITALSTGQRSDAVGLQQQNLKATFEATRQVLRQSGMSEPEANSKAMLAVLNPEAGKTILPEALTSKEQFKTITDAMGNQVPIFVNERDQTINGKPIGAEGSSPTGGAGFLSPGVKQIDSSLTGKDYLEQFSPEIQAAVQNYADGKSMPTGNPRKGFTQTVKMIAQKYGADTGQSIDDTTYAARRTMRNQLSSSSPSSLGGQINIGNTAAGHLADLTQKAVELGNVDTGIAPLTSAVNSVRGLGTEQAAKMEALKGAAQHYGQEITKFYAGSPGGTAERDRFIESVNGARSPKELAAILSTEGELMRSRLDALGGQIKGVLGEEGLKQYPVLRPDGESALTKVEHNVSRLRGGQSSSTGAIPSGWSVKVH